jgi:hypothetical protein
LCLYHYCCHSMDMDLLNPTKIHTRHLRSLCKGLMAKDGR